MKVVEFILIIIIAISFAARNYFYKKFRTLNGHDDVFLWENFKQIHINSGVLLNFFRYFLIVPIVKKVNDPQLKKCKMLVNMCTVVIYAVVIVIIILLVKGTLVIVAPKFK